MVSSACSASAAARHGSVRSFATFVAVCAMGRAIVCCLRCCLVRVRIASALCSIWPRSRCFCHCCRRCCRPAQRVTADQRATAPDKKKSDATNRKTHQRIIQPSAPRNCRGTNSDAWMHGASFCNPPPPLIKRASNKVDAPLDFIHPPFVHPHRLPSDRRIRRARVEAS